jgi:glycosyltransferase involved in cell wall biosynthesis
MRIGFIKANLNVGGVEINQLELSRLFVAAGFEVDVWSFGGGTAPWMAEHYMKGGVKLLTGTPDDVNVYDIIIVMVPSLYYPLLENYTGKLYCIVGNRAETYYSHEANERLNIAGCICDSQDTVDFVNDITPGTNCTKWFYMKDPVMLDVESNRASFTLPSNAYTFGTMCRLTEQKRIDRIIQAYGQAITQGMKNTHLAIAGSGPLDNKLRALAAAQIPDGSYTFVGHQPPYKTGTFLSSLDCFLTSHEEGQGGICMCANEAVGAGCYLLVGDVGGIKENILDPEFGILLDNDLLDDSMPLEMCKLSIVGQQHLRDRIKNAYRDMYDKQKGIVEWIQQ